MESLLVIGGLIFWIWSIGWHFLFHEIPLGYDPGLYKVMFEEMGALAYREWSSLSWRVQNMYPPFLGMVGALLMQFGATSQWLVTRWAVGISWLIVISISALARRILWTRWACVVFFLVCSSFVLYQLFWRWYLKQMLGVFLLMSTVHVLLLRKWLIQYILVWLLLGVGWLTQRPFLVLGWIVWVIWLLVWVIRDCKVMRGALVALGVLSSIWRYFREIQIVPMIQPFFDAIDVPSYNDGYKSWGTFLTMSQRIKTDRIVLIGSCIWWRLLIWDKKWRKNNQRLLIIWGILLFWVVAQLSFYQRMIWYLSPFLILMSGYAIVTSSMKYKRYLIGFGLFAQLIVSWIWINRTRPPIINPVEYAMIQQIPELVEHDAIIMVSWIRYSPRVKWRSWREVIAPWLFDYTARWNQWEWWTDYWIDSTWDVKCDNARNTFWTLDRPLYVWVWVSQEKESINGYCMGKVLDHDRLPSALYQLTYDN